jgi:hypothetical protein
MTTELSFRDGVCLPLLRSARNSGGGWGSHAGAESATEPTCLALLALSSGAPDTAAPGAAGDSEYIRRGIESLRNAQLADGSFPAFAGQDRGCWVTSLACIALRAHNDATGSAARGIAWLCNEWPADGSLWWRLRTMLSPTNTVVRQDSTLRGWNWIPGTASWAEPTAIALLALNALPSNQLPKIAATRRDLGARMLYDRMCPGGGWNSGNPLIYGVAGIPRIGPTCWALLALRENIQRPENQQSLRWLRGEYENIRGPISLALAHICLRAYGQPLPPLEPALRSLYAANNFLHSVHALAWTAIALRGANGWLGPAGEGN